MRKALFGTVALLLIWAMVESVSAGTLVWLAHARHLEYRPSGWALAPVQKMYLERFLKGETDGEVQGFDAELGWSPRPNAASADGTHRINSQGLRSDREYSPKPAAGVLRIAAYGDSFTESSEVDNVHAWPARMEAQNPRVEVLNYGVIGYGPDQALLRYRREAAGLGESVVFFGVMSENIFRLLNTFRPFYLRSGWEFFAKPRFAVEGDRLKLIRSPVRRFESYRSLIDNPDTILPRLGRHDFYYRLSYRRGPLDFLPSARLLKVLLHQIRMSPDRIGIIRNGFYNTRHEGYRILSGVTDDLVARAGRLGAEPVILIFPRREDIERYRKTGTRVYQPFLDELRRKNYRFVDLMDALTGDGAPEPDQLFIQTHYSNLGNQRVADFLLEYLRAGGWMREAGLPAA